MIGKKIKKKKTTIYEVAKEVGVSPKTISNYINKSAPVNKETGKKIEKAVNKLNYMPNIFARGLKLRSTKTIGVIVPDLTNPYFAQVIVWMEKIARKRNYTIILGNTFYDKEEEKRQVNTFLSQFIDGIVFFCGNDNYENVKLVYDSNIPTVVVDREINNNEIPSVCIDNTAAMEKAVDYLYSLGHRNIGYITFSFKNQQTIRRRYEGYIKGIKKNGISYNSNYVIIDDSIKSNELDGTYNIIKNCINKDNLPTAFIGMSDFVATALISVFSESGYKIPEDISVMGFDNEKICKFTIPPLTTVKQPKKEMGTLSMGLLLDIIEGKKIKNKSIILPTTIIERKSTCKI